MSATGEVAAALYGVLAPVATDQGASGPYDTVVPQRAAFPRLVFQIETDVDLNDTPTRAQEVTASVRVISETGFKQARAILDAVDAALHNQMLTVTGQVNYDTHRERATPSIAELRSGGDYYWNAGNVYRLSLEEA